MFGCSLVLKVTVDKKEEEVPMVFRTVQTQHHLVEGSCDVSDMLTLGGGIDFHELGVRRGLRRFREGSLPYLGQHIISVGLVAQR